MVTACSGFCQPGWITEYTLPLPSDVFWADSVTVGRAVGLLTALAGTVWTNTALEFLGDQYHSIGVSALPSRGLLHTSRRLRSPLYYR